MPTILLVDCSLGMAERFSFVIKQGDDMETTMNVEKRSLISKLIESLMTNTHSPTKLETIALVNLFSMYRNAFILLSFMIRFSLLEKTQLKSCNISQEILTILLNLHKKFPYSVIIH